MVEGQALTRLACDIIGNDIQSASTGERRVIRENPEACAEALLGELEDARPEFRMRVARSALRHAIAKALNAGSGHHAHLTASTEPYSINREVYICLCCPFWQTSSPSNRFLAHKLYSLLSLEGLTNTVDFTAFRPSLAEFLALGGCTRKW